ncbi:hypothetical protein K402DRAFT_302140, partial [Aulographum hederae CBS 113979]
CHEQDQSPLFSVIPAEVRNEIFAYALVDFEDTSKQYETGTYYTRPNYTAPRKSETALLRTCQRIYREAWFRPWTSAEHAFYLTADERRPAKVTAVESMQPTLDLIHSVHGKVEIDSVRVFPQMYALEPGHRLSSILDMNNFHPRIITITVRHGDWWHWENDKDLSMRAQWVNECRFPDSVREIRMELESLERKKGQVDSISSKMVDRWQFTRKDGKRMSAKGNTTKVDRWSGSSTFDGKRWIRDESEEKPELLDYYVLTVTFRPTKEVVADP